MQKSMAHMHGVGSSMAMPCGAQEVKIRRESLKLKGYGGGGYINVGQQTQCWVNPFRPEFTIVIFTNYKPRIAIAILDL